MCLCFRISGLANFNLSGVSSKASASAKSVGSFFSSAFTKAGDSVKAASSKIKETVEKNVSTAPGDEAWSYIYL